MRQLILTLIALAASLPAVAQDLPAEQRATALGGLRPLVSADAAMPWTGVGRLDTGVSFCSATLITDRLVLTAAHCLFDPATAERIADADLTFQAGLRNGRPEALRGVRRSHVPEAYAPRDDPTLESIGMDLALLELELPVRSNRIAPIATGRRADPETVVTVVSYGAEREAHASIEEGCLVLEGQGAVRLLSCRVVQGSSGAPVIRLTEDGPELVAVISATARDRSGADVSMAVALDAPFIELLDAMERGAGRPGGAAGQGRLRMTAPAGDGGRSSIGARFIRP
ncbi:trypsin-like serine protease [Roseibacterium sp. SDUM158017]|uniref:trypsin-like serine peptidase n=1 Tax=Roseicyclus salinarum TaxID=3036773 RepID=UPI0024155171|nr:trypsin-like serine protease [Roseibacterium sp. SDUM158017]MDG4649541.1 trypsin-like serine protease [Roseibacterium sp. SDUM158017]